MNSTKKLECTSCVERSDGCAIIAVECDIDSWRTWFSLGLRGVPIPGTIFDNVLCCCIINHSERLAFRDVYRGYKETGSCHMNLRSFWDIRFIINRTGSKHSG